ncbi:MAG: D-aminoacylase [Chthonomonadales bacterium]|nr:D-aminoacylase [Chthonomonadales bacterium]
MFDLLIRGGRVVDGTGAPGFDADVAVRDGRIAAVERLPATAGASDTVDAVGMVVAPGFIDIHTHADIALLTHPEHLPKVMQGVTTEVFSNCGLGFAPVTPEALGMQRAHLGALFGDDAGADWPWRSVGDLLARYEEQGIGTNAAYLIPHGAVRVSAMGMAARPATHDERAQMLRLVEEGMADGAWGLSTGLWYAPMCHADRAETVALCRAAGFFATHQRDYGAGLFAATEETVAISEEAGAPVQLSHLQLSGEAARGRSADILTLLDGHRARGVDITWDSYPYGAGATLVGAILPAWASDGGPAATLGRLADPGVRARIAAEVNDCGRDWAATVLLSARTPANRALRGLSFAAIAQRLDLTPGQWVVRLLREEGMQACYLVHQMDDAEVDAIQRHPAQMVGSDGLHLPGGGHPRLWGTFARVLGSCARERRVVCLEEAVRKMTGAPAARLGLGGRGVLRRGAAADLVVFDPVGVADTATYEQPESPPSGIPHVWVNGVAVKRAGSATGALPGRVLRRA